MKIFTILSVLTMVCTALTPTPDDFSLFSLFELNKESPLLLDPLAKLHLIVWWKSFDLHTRQSIAVRSFSDRVGFFYLVFRDIAWLLEEDKKRDQDANSVFFEVLKQLPHVVSVLPGLY